jgi:hypothetical protein
MVKTSMRLPLLLVVMISCCPSGVKPIWPGVFRNCSGPVTGVSCRERVESSIGWNWPSVIRYPVIAPASWALTT